MVIVGGRLSSHMTQKKTECRQTGSEFGISFHQSYHLTVIN